MCIWPTHTVTTRWEGTIEEVSSYRYLGIVVTPSLSLGSPTSIKYAIKLVNLLVYYLEIFKLGWYQYFEKYMSHVSDHTWNMPIIVQTMKPCSIAWIYLHYWLAIDAWWLQLCLTLSVVTTTFHWCFYEVLHSINKTIKPICSFCSHPISFFSFVPSVTRLWNLLRISVKTSTNILEFKRLLIDYIMAYV